jgi:pimeloyl-ACP methyl ester carboxylesterase
MSKYSITETLKYVDTILANLEMSETVLIGHSMGGVIATYMAKKHKPQKLCYLVSTSQVGTEEDLAGKYKEWKELGYRDVQSKKFGLIRIPFSFIQDAQKYNALDIIADLDMPKLFIVAGNDDKVPLHLSLKLFHSAKEPKSWHLIDGMEHKYQYQDGMIDVVNNLIIKFLISKKL